MYIHDLILRAEVEFASRLAVVGGTTRLTYAEVGLRVRRLAAALRACGIGTGDVVACLSHNSHRMMEVFFAASLAGAAVTPINTRLAPPETNFILKDAGAKLLLAGSAFLPTLDQILADTAVTDCVLLDDPTGGGVDGDLRRHDYETWINQAAPWSGDAAPWSPERMVLLCYTGGTTGVPKGVMLSQRNVMANAEHAIGFMGLSGDEVWLHAAPMFHLADAWACFSVTALGGRHVFMPRFQSTMALDLIEIERVTATSIVPTMIQLLLHDPACATRDTRSLRRVLYGASPMPLEPLKSALARFGPILQQAYGQSEASPFLAVVPDTHLAFPESETGVARLASCGRALPGIALRIVRPDGSDCASGEVGEVIARGPNVMLGYWKRPKETAAALAGGWLHTGDLARQDEDGWVFIVDRAKDVIISGGENIYSSEVENALYRHPAVLEAAVLGAPHPEWGESVCAVVVLRPGTAVGAEELIAHCQTLIAKYKCPRRVEFRADLPKSGAGKVLKAELRRSLAQV